MRSKNLTLIFASILAIFLLTGFGSALTLTPSDSSKTITVGSNVGNANFTFNDSVMINSINVSVQNKTKTENVSSVDLMFSANLSDKLGFGDSFSKKFIVGAVNYSNASINETRDVAIVLENMDFAEDTSNIDNKLDMDFEDEFVLERGFGDEDDNVFYPLDEITAEFNLDNKGDWDVDDIELTACLFDKTERECIIDEEDMGLSEDDFDLDDDDDKDLEISFKIDPDELNGGNDEYRLFIKAKGEIDSDKEGYDGNKTAVSEYKD